MKKEFRRFIDAVDTVLNSRTLLLVFNRTEVPSFETEKETIRGLFLSELFDAKPLEQDLLEQDGDFFHQPEPRGNLIPIKECFIKKDELSCIELEHPDALKYLTSMLTAEGKQGFRKNRPTLYERFRLTCG